MTLCAFDLLELDGMDLRPEPIEVRKCRSDASDPKAASSTTLVVMHNTNLIRRAGRCIVRVLSQVEWRNRQPSSRRLRTRSISVTH